MKSRLAYRWLPGRDPPWIRHPLMPPRISLVDVKDVVLSLLVPNHNSPVVLPHPGDKVKHVHLAEFNSVGNPTLDSLVNISMGPMYSRLSRLSMSRWADWEGNGKSDAHWK